MKKTLRFLPMLFAAFSYGQVTIGSGTNVDGNAGLSTPISNWYNTSLSQCIYLASEINASGNITGMTFVTNGTASLTNSNDMIDVWIGHTTKSAYTPVVDPSGADWVPISGQTQVMANASITQAGNVVTYTFSTPFAYNGTDNLVITVDANEPENDGPGMLYRQAAATPNIRSLMIRADDAAANADPANLPLNYSGSFDTESVQAKNTRPIITLLGLTALGISEHNGNGITLYPNPVRSELFVTAESLVATASFYNVSGQLIQAATVENNKISVSNLASGIYFVKCALEDGTVFTKRFVKE